MIFDNDPLTKGTTAMDYRKFLALDEVYQQYYQYYDKLLGAPGQEDKYFPHTEYDNLINSLRLTLDSNIVALQEFIQDYQDFVDRARLAGIDVPVVPGIMPITSRTGLNRMADLAAGTRFPAPLLRALDRVSDDQGVERVGTHWATAQVADLLNRDVPGIHLYTLNHSRATVQICRNLGLQSYRSVVMPESKKELSDL